MPEPFSPSIESSFPLASSSQTYTRFDRTGQMITFALASVILIVARFLPPSPRGFGTHERLGLPPCPFLTLTGLPCAGCGLTTSFAHAAKFHFYEAFVTQPFGLLLFFVTAALVPVSCYFIYARISSSRVMNAVMTDRRISYPLLALFLTGWFYKLTVMLSG